MWHGTCVAGRLLFAKASCSRLWLKWLTLLLLRTADVRVRATQMTFAEIVFGWPAVCASLLVTSAGIVLRTWRVALAGAFVAAPFMMYLFATPRFGLIALPVSAAHFAAAYALRSRGRLAGAALFAPFVFLAGYVASVVGG